MFRFSSRSLAAACMIASAFLGGHGAPVHAGQSTASNDPSAACAPCHEAIYERYRKTPMANASGPAANGLTPADFRHAASATLDRLLLFAPDNERARAMSVEIRSGKRSCGSQ
jgi:hypothetical protein